ncbi:MAG: hypothetical protein QOF43_245 [Gaiellaceae bacterium]|nr:hypothetical protein [Gaiellaceae bacterium]
MKRCVSAALAVVVAAFVASVAGASGAPGLVSNGSPTGPFSKNKQNEPGLAVDQAHPQYVAGGANDEIDMEDCNAGDPTTCPFTPGVGVSGVYLSDNGGSSFTQPVYQGYSARNCVGPPGYTCTPGQGPIGTLPRYFERGLVSDGDPELAFGPQPDGHGGFSSDAGSRLYYANLASNFSAQRSETAFKGFEAIAVSRLDTQHFDDAKAGNNAAWMAPVLVSKQNSALFSDKEAVWADNAKSSRFFGYAYICNTSFRSKGGTPEPILFYRSTDGGDTWSNPNQLTAATNNAQNSGRQGCTIRTDSQGVVYVYYEGFDKQANASAIFQTRSFDGGQKFERPRAIAHLVDCGLPDPATGDVTFDGLAGARTDSFPSVDIANGAPSGSDATNEILLTYCDGPTPSVASPGPSERAPVKYSTDRGVSFQDGGNAAFGTERPNFPAIAISPDGSDAYVTYDAFFAPWQPTNADPRLMQAVTRHAEVARTSGAVGLFGAPSRGGSGDARGSSTNSLAGEFLGDYNYAVATRDGGITLANDVSLAADCGPIDAYRAGLASKPQEETECPLNFGNSDIFGGFFVDPTP